MGLRNSQYDAIIRQYNSRQLDNKHALDQRVGELYSKHKEFEEIDHKISSLSVKQAKKLLSGDANALGSLKEDICFLSRQRAALLASYGYPEDYLEMYYHCSDCQDTGYVNNKKCHCFKQATIDLLYTQSNIQEILKVENFEHFSYDYYSDEIINPSTGLSALATIKEVVSLSKDFIRDFAEEPQNIFLYGDTGVGKTFLSNCIAKKLIDSFHSVIYFTAFQLFDIFASYTFSKNSEQDDMYKYIFDCDLLIIDDLGTELTNSFVSSQLFLCVNERLLRKKSTIISTNLPLNTFVETYSERTFSRISSNYKTRKIIGDDIRIQKKINTQSP